MVEVMRRRTVCFCTCSKSSNLKHDKMSCLEPFHAIDITVVILKGRFFSRYVLMTR